MTKRVAYDVELKLKAINYAKEHGNRPAARQEDELRLTRKTKKSFHGRKARWSELEDRLYHWISERRAVGRSLSTVAIRIQAKAIANQLHIEEFKAGVSWCFRFMKRQQLSIRTRTTACQQLPADYKEKVVSFRIGLARGGGRGVKLGRQAHRRDGGLSSGGELTGGEGAELTGRAGPWACTDERGEMWLRLVLGCLPARLSGCLKATRIRWECSQNDHTIVRVFFGL
uniref:HTH CENPB-type domain-containing protein n=1 Tax=Catharus ustulatus TaxID=91951 RepID=A0A8C3V4W3_CATUS